MNKCNKETEYVTSHRWFARCEMPENHVGPCRFCTREQSWSRSPIEGAMVGYPVDGNGAPL